MREYPESWRKCGLDGCFVKVWSAVPTNCREHGGHPQFQDRTDEFGLPEAEPVPPPAPAAPLEAA